MPIPVGGRIGERGVKYANLRQYSEETGLYEKVLDPETGKPIEGYKFHDFLVHPNLMDPKAVVVDPSTFNLPVPFKSYIITKWPNAVRDGLQLSKAHSDDEIYGYVTSEILKIPVGPTWVNPYQTSWEYIANSRLLEGAYGPAVDSARKRKFQP